MDGELQYWMAGKPVIPETADKMKEVESWYAGKPYTMIEGGGEPPPPETAIKDVILCGGIIPFKR